MTVKALIIVDVQNDFCPGGALAVPGGDRVIPIINELQERFELIVGTQDWHPADHASFAATHGKEPGDIVEVEGVQQLLWPVHCVQGTPGADFVEGLDRSRWAAVFQKGTHPLIDSYSAFYDNGHRASTGLESFLEEKGVSHVVIAGLATDYCVRYTAMDAVELGLETTVAIDACRGVGVKPGDIEQAIAEMRALGVHIAESDELGH